MRRLVNLLAFALLGLLGCVQSGLPAFLGEVWSHTAMYQEYQTIMSRREAIELVLRGDLGCGFFTELEAFSDAADSITLAWFEFSQPLLCPGARVAGILIPRGYELPFGQAFPVPRSPEGEIEPPPPRAAA